MILDKLQKKTNDRPAWRVVVNGDDITDTLKPRLMSLRVNDRRGLEQDTVEVELSDTDNALRLPPRGAKMKVWMGWPDEMVERGEFKIDEIEHSGPPDKMIIRGKSVDFRGSMLQLREQSYHETTLGGIFSQLAIRNSLQLIMSDDLRSEPVPHMDQQNESDAAFISRLALDHGLVPSIKSGRLLLLPVGTGKTASGKDIPVTIITKDMCSGHRFGVADREAYSGVIAFWQDDPAARKRSAKAKAKAAAQGKKNHEYMVGSTDNIKTLRHVYLSERSAKRAVAAEWDRLQRGVATLSLDLAKGIPGLIAETPINVRGFKEQIDSCGWVLMEVMDEISDAGYVCSLALEVRHDEIPEVE